MQQGGTPRDLPCLFIMLRGDDFCKSQIVLAGWRFGCDYGGYLATLLVASCLMNRVRAGWGSALEIVEKIPVFSAKLVESNADKLPNIWDPAFVRILHEVDAIYDGSGTDYAKGAKYYCDLRYVDREWFKTAILQDQGNHERVVEMNSLALFT